MICIQYAARFLNCLRRLIKWEPHGFLKISQHRIFKLLDKCWSFVDWSLIDIVMTRYCYMSILRLMYYGIGQRACLSVYLSVSAFVHFSAYQLIRGKLQAIPFMSDDHSWHQQGCLWQEKVPFIIFKVRSQRSGSTWI